MRVDIFLLSDATGSMPLENVKNMGKALMDKIAFTDLAYGVGFYADSSDPIPFKIQANIGSAICKQEIDKWTNSGGGDTPEAQFYALKQVANEAGWRTDSKRFIIWFGDNEGHDPSIDNVTLDNAIGELSNKGICVIAVNMGNPGIDTKGQATKIVSATNGDLISYKTVDETAQEVIDFLNKALEEKYVETTLELQGSHPLEQMDKDKFNINIKNISDGNIKFYNFQVTGVKYTPEGGATECYPIPPTKSLKDAEVDVIIQGATEVIINKGGTGKISGVISTNFEKAPGDLEIDFKWDIEKTVAGKGLQAYTVKVQNE